MDSLTSTLTSRICGAEGRAALSRLGCARDGDILAKAAERFVSLFDSLPKLLLSSPGRTELCGNHTDHQCGRVLAAAVSLSICAAVSRRDDGMCVIYSDALPNEKTKLSLSSLESVLDEAGTSASLVRGVAAYFKHHGAEVGGFNAVMLSSVPVGSGLSSSAAFEVLTSLIFSELYNLGRITPMMLAQAGQYAENVYFGKPCGLMDQAACALGGVNMIDFHAAASPAVQPYKWSFDDSVALYIVNTGSSHADMSDAYALITSDMQSVSAALGQKHLGHADENEFISKIPLLRSTLGDRAVMRALHFFEENKRVPLLAQAIESADSHAYSEIMRQSGASSESLLQNIFTPTQADRSLGLGIALARKFVQRYSGAARVHGGGFAGTLQALILGANDIVEHDFIRYMEGFFGAGSVFRAAVRPSGAVRLMEL